MIVGIVGSSKLTPIEAELARAKIQSIIHALDDNSDLLQIVTGDADGIDKIVREEVSKSDISLIIETSEIKRWEGKNGFKQRNLRIARHVDYLYCLVTIIKDQKCYHCNKDHQRSGGCWTLLQVEKRGKSGEVIVI